MMMETGDIKSLCDARNLAFPPITDPLYADSLALQAHLSSYDYIVSQPSVLTWEQGERLLDLLREPPKPLPGDEATGE